MQLTSEKTNNILVWVIRIGILAILFCPLIVGSKFFFPFIVPKNVLFRIFVEIIFLAFVILSVRDKKYRPSLNFLTVSIIVFFAISTVTSFFGISLYSNFWGNYERMGGLFHLWHVFTFFLVLISIFKNSRDWMRFLSFSVFASTVMTMIGFAQKIGVNFVIESAGGERLTGTIGNAAYLAAYVLINLFFLLYFFVKDQEFDIKLFCYGIIGIDTFLIFHDILNNFNQNISIRFISQLIDNKKFFLLFAALQITAFCAWYFRKQKYVLRTFVSLLFLFQFLVFFWTQTRGAILGFYGSILIFFGISSFLTKNKKFRYASIALFILFLATPLGVYFGNDLSFIKNQPTLSALTSISYDDITTQSRLLTWKASMKGWTENPIRFFFGYGDEGYYYIFNKYFPNEIYKDAGSQIWFDRAHNIIFDTGVNFGLIGLLSYLIIFGFSFVLLYKLFRKTGNFVVPAIFFSLLLAYFGQNFFVFDTLNTYILFYLTLGFIVFLWNEQGIGESKFIQSIKAFFQWPFSRDSLKKTQIGFIIIVSLLIFVSVYSFNIRLLQTNNMLYNAIRLHSLNGDVDEVSKLFEASIEHGVSGRYEARQQYFRAVLERARVENVDQKKIFPLVVRAATELEKSIEEEPLNVRHYLMLGSFLNGTSHINIEYANKAIRVLESAIELSPTRPQIYFELAQSYFITQNVEKGVEFMKQGLKLAPKVEEAHVDALNIYILAGLYDEADAEVLYIQNTLKYSFKDQDYERILKSYESRGDEKRIIALYEKALEEFPSNLNLQSGLASAYARTGQNEKARLLAENALKQDPSLKDKIEEFLKFMDEGKFVQQDSDQKIIDE